MCLQKAQKKTASKHGCKQCRFQNTQIIGFANVSYEEGNVLNMFVRPQDYKQGISVRNTGGKHVNCLFTRKLHRARFFKYKGTAQLQFTSLLQSSLTSSSLSCLLFTVYSSYCACPSVLHFSLFCGIWSINEQSKCIIDGYPFLFWWIEELFLPSDRTQLVVHVCCPLLPLSCSVCTEACMYEGEGQSVWDAFVLTGLLVCPELKASKCRI